MLRIVPATQRRQSLVIAKGCRSQCAKEDSVKTALTGVHGPKHACDELVNTITLLYKGYERRDAAFVVVGASEMGEDEFLELVYLVLQCHQV